MAWIGVRPPPERLVATIRVLCFLNHTSLFEWLFIAIAPLAFLWRVACHGVVPGGREDDPQRPIVGWFFKLLAAHVVSISRERDHTWREVLSRIDPDSMVVILPEGQDEARQRARLQRAADDRARRHRRHPRGRSRKARCSSPTAAACITSRRRASACRGFSARSG